MKTFLIYACIHLLLLGSLHAQSSNIWVVAVGISTYRYPTRLSALQGPVIQAYEFTRILEKRGFTSKNIPILANAEATRPAILRNLKATFVDNPDIGPNDLIIFYYSGHGTIVGNKVGLCPFDYYDQQQLIEDQDIIDIMKRSPAKHKVCFIEACKSETRLAGTQLSQRQLDRFNKLRNKIKGGLVFITSTEVGQPSYEPPDIGGGVFSHYLIRAIEGEADLDSDYSITSNELLSYLIKKVTNHTVGQQIPQVNSEGLTLNIPIFELPRPDLDIPDGFVLVEGGTFQMGDLFGEGEEDEQPIHTVQISSYFMASQELTFIEYDLFCARTGRKKPNDEGWGRDWRPVINVSWYDAIEYCNWLSQQEGFQPYYTINRDHQDPNNKNWKDYRKWLITTNENADGYRLPTEAEWEYAARQGGHKVRFCNGQDIADPTAINFDGSEQYKNVNSIVGTYQDKTIEAGSFPSNNLDLYDMSGNVWEWCWDWYDLNYYNVSTNRNPTGATSGYTRAIRGGSWFSDSSSCRASNRDSDYPRDRSLDVGIRLAKSLTQ